MTLRCQLTLGLFTLLLAYSLPTCALELKGRLEWQHRIDMRVLDSGVVEQANVTTGQYVSKGDLLVRMDQRKQKAALLEAKARVARTKLTQEAAERELARTRELFDRGLIAQEELKDSELQRAVATAEGESALAAQEAAEVALDHTELHAPFDAIVVASNVWQGAVIFNTKQDQPLITLAPSTAMLARVLVTADLLRQYPVGTTAQVIANGNARAGSVYSRGVEAVRIEPEGAVYELDIAFQRRDKELLRPAENVKVILP